MTQASLARPHRDEHDEPRIYWDIHCGCWRLAHEMRVRIHGYTITVPKGFETDLASVPPIFSAIISSFGNFNKSSILHDFLYENKGVLVDGTVLSRQECDRIFFDVMVLDGTTIWQAVIMWAAVRCWGFFFF